MNNLLKKLIFEIKTKIKLFRKYNSINQIDKKVNKYLNYRNGFYIECGAFDGVNQSNTWFFEKVLNWHGILIEPNPKYFKKLLKYRSKRNFFFNEIITSENNCDELLLIDNNFYSKITSQKTMSKNLISIRKNTLFQILKSKDLLSQQIDFFSLDVEGYEFEVIKGLGISIQNVKLFVIETDNFEKINEYLKTKRFKYMEKLSEHDYLFVNLNLFEINKNELH